MIEKMSEFTYELSCDNCSNYELFETFSDAVEFKKDKDNGWKSKKANGDWQDLCPRCNGEVTK